MLFELLMLLLTIWLVIYIYFKIAFRYFKRHRIPHLRPSFPFGNMGKVILRQQCMANKMLDVYNELKSKGHKYAGLYFFSRRAYLLMDPELVKRVFCTDFQHFYDRGIFYDEKNDPVSAHLFSLAGDKWKILRTKLTPAFTPGKVKYMFPNIVSCAWEMIKFIGTEKHAKDGIEIKDLLARYTTDVIGSCAYGLDCNCFRNPEAEFRRMGKRAFTQTKWDAFKMVVIRSIPNVARLLKFSIFAPVVSKFFKNVIEETIDYRENNNVTRPDFLQLLIEIRNEFSKENNLRSHKTQFPYSLSKDEIAAQAFIFFLAGFETTSTAMSFALLELCLNQDIQDKARTEILHVLEKYNDEISYDAINELRYVEQIISESMRKYPPAPVYLRRCTKDYQIPETNVIIEEGVSVLIPAVALHRDPQYFPDPLLFDPDRFNEDNKPKIKDFTYIPFGDGPRICIGMRMAMVQAKLAIMIILGHFKLSLNKRTPWPIEMETTGIIFTTKGGLWINFEEI